MRQLLYFVVSFALMYLLFSLTQWDFNPANWGAFLRLCWVVGAVLLYSTTED
jgi:hypothetical protein